MTESDLSLAEIDSRIQFHDAEEIMEASFADLRLDTSAEVNRFYDRLEERIAQTGHTRWFFLVNYCDTRIDTSAWFAFSRRGKHLNKAHSMGSVRFDASEITLRQIKNAGSRENFDPNLFFDRESAWAHLLTLPSTRPRQTAAQPLSFTRADLESRVSLLVHEDTMYADFSDMSFEHAADVDLVYDYLEEVMRPTDRKWFFLVNYNDTRIQSPAWVRFSARGKRLNKIWSLGSVRFATGSETEKDIRMRAESQDFRPNIRNTMAEAKARIAEMRGKAMAG